MKQRSSTESWSADAVEDTVLNAATIGCVEMYFACVRSSYPETYPTEVAKIGAGGAWPSGSTKTKPTYKHESLT
jgi:hypothetical protein